MENCRRCGDIVQHAYGFAVVSTNRGETSLERLQNYRRYVFCDDCARELQEWLGITSPVVSPPISCFDERISLGP